MINKRSQRTESRGYGAGISGETAWGVDKSAGFPWVIGGWGGDNEVGALGSYKFSVRRLLVEVFFEGRREEWGYEPCFQEVEDICIYSLSRKRRNTSLGTTSITIRTKIISCAQRTSIVMAELAAIHISTDSSIIRYLLRLRAYKRT